MDPTTCGSSGRRSHSSRYRREQREREAAAASITQQQQSSRKRGSLSGRVVHDPHAHVSVQFEAAPTGHSRAPSSCGGGGQSCWSPDGELPPQAGPPRPLGGIEKLLEYRTIPNGRGQVEVRRMAASVDGPVEHIQVVNTQPSDRDSKDPPWLDYEGHPAQAAAIWGNGISSMLPPPPPPQTMQDEAQQPASQQSMKRQSRKPDVGGHHHHHQQPQQQQSKASSYPTKYKRLHMNGSQPCLMTLERAEQKASSSGVVGSGSGSGGGGSLAKKSKSAAQQHHQIINPNYLLSSDQVSSYPMPPIQFGPKQTTAAGVPQYAQGMVPPPPPPQQQQGLVGAPLSRRASGSQPCLALRPPATGASYPLPPMHPPLQMHVHTLPHGIPPPPECFEDIFSTSVEFETQPPTAAAVPAQAAHQKAKFRRSESFTSPHGHTRSAAGIHSARPSTAMAEQLPALPPRSTSRSRQHSGAASSVGQSGMQPPPQKMKSSSQAPPPCSSRSQSPLSVVRAKRASQAQWEKQQKLKNQQQKSDTGELDAPDAKAISYPSVGPSLHPHSESLSRSRAKSQQQQSELKSEFDQLGIPPPPSPPCTCGKNLELPPSPPIGQAPLQDNERLGSRRAGSFRQRGGAPGSMTRPSSSGARPRDAWDSQSLDSRLAALSSSAQRPRSAMGARPHPHPYEEQVHGGHAHSLVNVVSSCLSVDDEDDDDESIVDFGRKRHTWTTLPSTEDFAPGLQQQQQHRQSFRDLEYCPDLIVQHHEQIPPPQRGVGGQGSQAHQGQPGQQHMPSRVGGTKMMSYLNQTPGSVPAGPPAGGGGLSNGHTLSNGHAHLHPHPLPHSASVGTAPASSVRKKRRKRAFKATLLQGERGVSLEFGKFVALISISGVRFRRQHWCCLSFFLLALVLCIAVGLPLSGGGEEIPKTPEGRMALVQRLLTEVPLVDGHNDLPWNIRKFIHNKLHTVNFTYDLRNLSPWGQSSWSHTDLNRLRQGRVGAQLWVAYAPCGSQHKDAVQVTLEQMDLIKRLISQYPGYLAFVNDSNSLLEAHAEGKTASLISVESGHSIGTSLAVLRMFHRLGAVSLTLTHNCNTPWADSSNVDKEGGLPVHNGLSQFGKTVIKEMNRLGMIIDLSHSSHQTSKDALETSEAPVIFSHSSAFGKCNSTRNVQDDLLKLVGKKRGLVMVNFFSYFITCANESTIHDVVGHLNYIKEMAGVDSVGIGASYDGINSAPTGLEDVSKYPELFATLLASGMWTIEDLKKLAGLNFLRVFKEVEKVSARLHSAMLPSEEFIKGEDIQDYSSCRSVKRDANTTAC